MKIALLARSNLFSLPGGDTEQVQQIQQHLIAAGHDAQILLTPKIQDLPLFDVFHFFNLGRPETLLLLLPHIKKKPLVISTIFVDYSEAERFHPSLLRRVLFNLFGPQGLEYLKTLGRVLNGTVKINGRYFLMGQNSAIKKVLGAAQLLVTSSDAEAARIQKTFKCFIPMLTLPLGLHPDFKGAPILEEKRPKAVLCVGRIEPLKNQLRLVEICTENQWPLTIVGPVSPQQKNYFAACKKAAGPLVQFLPHSDAAALKVLYQTHAVHAGASFFETFHLATLEALALGCRPVMSAATDAAQVFQEYAILVNPASKASIATGIKKAFDWPVTPAEQQKTRQLFDWETHVNKLVEAYQSLLFDATQKNITK